MLTAQEFQQACMSTCHTIPATCKHAVANGIVLPSFYTVDWNQTLPYLAGHVTLLRKYCCHSCGCQMDSSRCCHWAAACCCGFAAVLPSIGSRFHSTPCCGCSYIRQTFFSAPRTRVGSTCFGAPFHVKMPHALPWCPSCSGCRQDTFRTCQTKEEGIQVTLGYKQSAPLSAALQLKSSMTPVARFCAAALRRCRHQATLSRCR